MVFAYIPTYLNVPGNDLSVELLGDLRPAKVLEGPPALTQPVREKNASL